MKNITAGFATTGIFPVNRNAVRLPIAREPSKPKKVSFIPTYTPSKHQATSHGIKNSYCLPQQSSLRCLDPPSPPARPKSVDSVSSGRVLTNAENLQILEAKKKEREEKKSKNAEKGGQSKHEC